MPLRQPSDRRIVLTTDNPDHALRTARELRRQGDFSVQVAEIRNMDDPPKTALRYCVFRYEDKAAS